MKTARTSRLDLKPLPQELALIAEDLDDLLKRLAGLTEKNVARVTADLRGTLESIAGNVREAAEVATSERVQLDRIEYEAHQVTMMAGILGEMIAELFADQHGHERITGHENCWFFNKQQVDRLVFAGFHVHDMADDLEERVNGTLEGKVEKTLAPATQAAAA